MRIEVDPMKCDACGLCKEACPKGPLIWDIGNIAQVDNLRYCHLCILCASACPKGAITVIRDDNDGKKEKITEKE